MDMALIYRRWRAWIFLDLGAPNTYSARKSRIKETKVCYVRCDLPYVIVDSYHGWPYDL